MDTLDIRNLQLSYQAVYDKVLCESMEDLGIIGEARDGYGDDSKFNKPDDKIEKPGTTVPKPKKGGYGRISRSTPYGIGAHANRTTSRVTTIVGEDPGAPRSEKMAREVSKKKGPKMVKKDGKWVKEALDYYDIILEYLIYEGYADTVENAEAIMVNMSEEWVGDIVEEFLDEELTGERKKRALKKGFKHLATAKEGSSVTKNVDENMPSRRGGGSGIKRNPNRWGRPGTVKPGSGILNRDDRGSGNRAARRAGKKVKDNEDRYYWNDKDENF